MKKKIKNNKIVKINNKTNNIEKNYIKINAIKIIIIININYYFLFF